MAEKYFERLKNSTFDELSLENFLSNILFLWAQLSNKKIDQGLETYKNISDYYNNLKKLQNIFILCHFDDPKAQKFFELKLNKYYSYFFFQYS